MTIYIEDFAGSAADLTTPWVQLIAANPMRRNGSGVGVPTTASSDSAVAYNNTVGADQYSQIVPNFTGPGDGSRYIYLFLRTAATADALYTENGYWFWSDGGSDTQILYTVYGGGGGPFNIKTDNTFTFSSGDTIKFEVVGTTLKVYKNGTLWSGLTVTDSHYASGKPGFGLYVSSGATVDDWGAGM